VALGTYAVTLKVRERSFSHTLKVDRSVSAPQG